MTTLILASTPGSGWKADFPRHLAPILGEPLLFRTVRQCNARGQRPIVVGPYAVPGADRADPARVRDGFVQEQEPSRHLWPDGGVVRILYGDTVYSDALMDAVTSDWGDPWRVFGRIGGSTTTGKPHGEMFAWVVAAAHYRTLDDARNRLVADYLAGRARRALGWELWHVAAGRPTHSRHLPDGHFRHWDDESDDIDKLADLDARVAHGLA